LKLKAGIGYDIHRLAAGRQLLLGGTRLPSPVGLSGHSDADALVHALVDALLGASGDGDIGRLFPDTDPTWKDAASTVLLKAVMARLRKAGLEVVNVDTVIVAEKPAIAPYVAAMKRVLCPILGIKPDALGIKGKTNEGLGPIGHRKAIACLATVLLSQKPRKRSA
jgi:2-C-methyl-D-erythritol 2,4-cyclodiphosphate synthase